jgi:hypothetical protein
MGIDPSGYFSITSFLSATALSLNMRLVLKGVIIGAMSNAVFSAAEKIFLNVFRGRGFVVDDLFDIAEDAIIGGALGAFGTVFNAGVKVHRAMRAFLGLRSFSVAKQILSYIGTPATLKGIMCTFAAMYKDWINNKEAWSVGKTMKTLFSSVLFAGVFEGISYGSGNLLKSMPGKIKGLTQSWNREWRIWQGGRNGKAFIARMRTAAGELKHARSVENWLTYLEGTQGTILINLAESFANSMSSKEKDGE